MTGGGQLDGRASGQGRVFQASGDQYIEEHHHHYEAGTAPLLERLVVRPGAPGTPVAAPDSVRVPLVGRAPTVVRDRAELRALLRTAVSGAGDEVHVVHGMGGCGKTTVALWLFTEAVRELGRVGLWVNASERMSLRAGMLAVAGDRGATTGELAAAAGGQRAAADLVWHYLDRSAEPWLLVLDNADDPAVLEEGGWLRTSPSGTVLVTTRHATSPLWRGPGVSRHALGVLPLEDAAQVLCDLAPDAGTPESARKVAERLGCLPLALTLAGSHLAHQLLESWSMDEYDRKLAEQSTSLVDQGAQSHGSNQSRQLVGRTWQLSLDALAAQDRPEATTLLRLLSFWAAEPVPVAVLMPIVRGEVELNGLEHPPAGTRLEPALRALLDHSLIEMVDTAGSRCVQAHGVLLDSVAAAVPAAQRTAFLETAAALLVGALPTPDVPPVDARVRLAALAPHAMRLLSSAPVPRAVEPAVLLTRQLYEAGEYTTVLPMARAAERAVSELLGEHDPLALATRYTLAAALFRTGWYAESEAAHREVLEARERVLGPEHPDTLESCFGLHQPLNLLGRLQEAEEALRRAVAGQRKVLGEHAPALLRSRLSLAIVLNDSQKFDEFAAEAPSVAEDCRRALGPDHPVTLDALHSYADGLRVVGRHDEAEALGRRVLADRIRVQGRDHPLALATMSMMARLAQAQGRTAEAVSRLDELIERREQVLGPDHPFIAENREWRAEWLAGAAG
ncbi:tetratricopeptide repeat protein [Streptomyces sp. SYSU K21746]